MPGPQPTPTNLKLLFGNPGKRALPENEPMPELGIPDVPDWLSGDGQKLWPTFATMLNDMKVLTTADQAALAILCEDFATFIALAKDIQCGGRYQTVMTKSGDVMERKRPVVDDLDSTIRRCMSHLREFGLTPAARTKVAVTTGDDAADALIKKYMSHAG